MWMIGVNKCLMSVELCQLCDGTGVKTPCDDHADCQLEQDQVTCRCRQGYTGDGYNCTGDLSTDVVSL